MERQIERVLILADEPIFKRPFPVELVKAALPDACRKDAPLCASVRRYLERYQETRAHPRERHRRGQRRRARGAAEPARHDEQRRLGALRAGYVQPSDYLLVSAGGIGYSGRTQATGSMLSVGASWAQLDAGYRDHWLSPMTDTGSMLFSTESPTSPSVTLSNWEPLTRSGSSTSSSSAGCRRPAPTPGRASPATTSSTRCRGRGDPHLFSTQLSIEPFPGWSLGVNRNLEYGGGSGLPGSANVSCCGISSSRAGVTEHRAISRPPTSAASSFPARRPLPCIFSTRARTTPTGAAISWVMPPFPPASISRASGATSMRLTRSRSGRTSGTCTTSIPTA